MNEAISGKDSIFPVFDLPINVKNHIDIQDHRLPIFGKGKRVGPISVEERGIGV